MNSHWLPETVNIFREQRMLFLFTFFFFLRFTYLLACFLAVVGLSCCTGVSLVAGVALAVCGLLVMVASLVAVHRF